MPYESLQKKLSRARPPQVHIVYDVEVGDAIEKRELPFVVGVLADLSGTPAEPLPRLRDRRFMHVDRDDFDAMIGRVRPRLELRVPIRLLEDDDGSQLAVVLTFQALADFFPDAVASQIPALSELLSVRDRLKNVQAALFGNDKLEEKLQEILVHPDQLTNILRELQAMRSPLSPGKPGEMVEELLDSARVRRSAEDRAAAAGWLTDFLEQASRGDVVVSRDTESIINARIAAVDHAITRQLNEVMHHPDFQRLEATWRSLWYLVDQTETSVSLQIRVLNVTKKDLLRDLERAPEFDQSAIFKKIYEEEYGTVGGTPFALLIADYYFDRDPPDVSLLSRMAQVAAEAHVVFIAGAGPGMFNLTSFSELTLPRDLSKIFDTAEYGSWKIFRQSPDARFIGLVLPRMLLRLPYGTDTNPVARFQYEEQVAAHEQYLWGNAAFALGVRISDSFTRFGWYAAIRGVEGGGLITGLPAYQTLNDDGETVLQCPTEIAITDRREMEIARLGFIPLLHVKNSDCAVFFSVHSCYLPQLYREEEANIAAAASAGLDCVLAVSRFTHYLRCLMRDKIGSFRSVPDCEQYLNQWLAGYVLLTEDAATTEAESKAPLSHGKVQLEEVAGRPGKFRAILGIQPRFQFANIQRPMRAIVMLPQSAYL